jgi:hypothetical protein
VVDALLRKEEEKEGSLCVISILQSNWVEEARIEWKKDKKVCKIIRQLKEDPNSLDNFVWNNYFLWYHDRLYLCIPTQIECPSRIAHFSYRRKFKILENIPQDQEGFFLGRS